MDEHVSVCWTADPDPGKVEKQLIARYALPLNLEHNSAHPFAPELEKLLVKPEGCSNPSGK